MRKLVINDWVPGLVSGDGEEWWAVQMACTCFGGFLLGGSGSIETACTFRGRGVEGWFQFVEKMGLSKECKNLDAVVPNELLAANADAVAYQMEEYKNSDLVVILHCLNSFQHNNYVGFSLLYIA